MTTAKLSELVTNYKAGLDGDYQPSSNFDTPIPEHASEFWAVMAELFGSKWTGPQPTTPTPGWIFALADLTPKQVGHGLMVLRDSGAEWPPSAPQFRAMCFPAKRENSAAYHVPPSHQLEKKISDEDRAKGRSELTKMRAKL